MFTKPNVKSVTSAGATALAIVAGAKIGDGIVAVMPDSTSSYKKLLVGAVSLIAAASVSAKTPVAQGVQNALIGVGVKQLCDEVTDNLTSAVAKKGTADAAGAIVATSVTDKFINAVVGHLGTPAYSLGAAWDSGVPSQVWDRPVAELAPSFEGLTML